MSRYTPTDLDTLARTIFGEARGEPFLGQRAVAHVVLNRLRAGRYGRSIDGVCRRPWQFSCWNKGDPNLERLLNVSPWDWRFAGCQAAAWVVLSGNSEDPTAGATHYCTRQLFNDAPPKWARGLTPCAELGAHVVFNNVD